MRCSICDKALGESEIKIDPRYGTFDPCTECLTIISETFGEEGDEVEETVEDVEASPYWNLLTDYTFDDLP